ncbi:MAG: RraA family protein [Phycisphaeraceae bacterium]
MNDDRQEILRQFEGLRVTDVVDAMDGVGYFDRGQVSPNIRPLWRDIDQFKHRIYGIAHTVRFIPTDKPVPRLGDSFDAWRKWVGEGYGLAQGPMNDDIQPGDVIVIDGENCGTTGFIGSNNSLAWLAAGAVGAVTNGGCRDTDELIKQQVPVYSRYISKTIRPGRLELDALQVNVNIGGAVVRPGDVIAADGDGVVCVPRQIAAKVAEYAAIVAEGDKKGRRKLYETLGKPADFTVEA